MSYSTPAYTGPVFGNLPVGGSPTASGNYWDSDLMSGLIAAWPTPAPTPHGSGLPTAQLQSGFAFSGWDTSKWSFGANSYPLLKNVPGLSLPTQLTAVPASNSVVLNWNAPTQINTSGWVTYSIYRGTQIGSETLIQSSVADTTWTDSAANNPSSPPGSGTLYYYRVQAVANGIPSAISARVSATPQ